MFLRSLALNRPTVCAVVAPPGRRVPFTTESERIVVVDRQRFDEELGLSAQRAGVQIGTGLRVERVVPMREAVQVASANGWALAARASTRPAGGPAPVRI